MVAETDDKEFDEDVDAETTTTSWTKKRKTATLTATRHRQGREVLPDLNNLADDREHRPFNHHINQAIKARGVMKKDIDYVVKDNEVIIVDEFTGRLDDRPPL